MQIIFFLKGNKPHSGVWNYILPVLLLAREYHLLYKLSRLELFLALFASYVSAVIGLLLEQLSFPSPYLGKY